MPVYTGWQRVACNLSMLSLLGVFGSNRPNRRRGKPRTRKSTHFGRTIVSAADLASGRYAFGAQTTCEDVWASMEIEQPCIDFTLFIESFQPFLRFHIRSALVG